jgi:hypothetical protein
VIAQISSNNILEILSEEDNDVVILKKIKWILVFYAVLFHI